MKYPVPTSYESRKILKHHSNIYSSKSRKHRGRAALEAIKAKLDEVKPSVELR